MGKYMRRKSKTIGEVSLMDSHAGVRTRAKTLAAVSYIQLRSRLLLKPALPILFQKVKELVDDQASFGDNVLEIQPTERSTRETTPCNLIRDPETIRTPGSSTKRSYSANGNYRVQNSAPRHIPSTNEMDEIFTEPEKQQQQLFIEKYNFDPVNEKPLPGRYEWAKVDGTKNDN